MAVWNFVSLAYTQRFNRTDAEFYRPEYEVAIQKVLACKGEELRQHAIITDGIHASPIIEPDGICYISAKCVRDNAFILDNCIRISLSQHAKNPRTALRSGDVVITTVGTIGNVAVVEDGMVPSNCDRHVGIVRLRNPSDVSPYFLATFLNSKYGRFQSLREAAGNVQLNLYIRNIGDLVVPRFGAAEAEIGRCTKEAYKLRCASRESYKAAEQLLESELGLDKLQFKRPVGYVASSSEVGLSRRFDSEHFYPAFKNFAESLPKERELSRLSLHLEFCQRGKQPFYSKQGIPVINSKHVKPNRVELEGTRVALETTRFAPRIQFGDVLLNGTGRGTLGRAAPYLFDAPALPDNHVTILRSKSLDPAFLSIYLNSAAGQLQVEMHQRGTSGQLELYPMDIRKFRVWNAPKPIQGEVRRLYESALASEQESRRLLEQAKSRVEQLIEEAGQA